MITHRMRAGLRADPARVLAQLFLQGEEKVRIVSALSPSSWAITAHDRAFCARRIPRAGPRRPGCSAVVAGRLRAG
jgi:hypothetical protein